MEKVSFLLASVAFMCSQALIGFVFSLASGFPIVLVVVTELAILIGVGSGLRALNKHWNVPLFSPEENLGYFATMLIMEMIFFLALPAWALFYGATLA